MSTIDKCRRCNMYIGAPDDIGTVVYRVKLVLCEACANIQAGNGDNHATAC